MDNVALQGQIDFLILLVVPALLIVGLIKFRSRRARIIVVVIGLIGMGVAFVGVRDSAGYILTHSQMCSAPVSIDQNAGHSPNGCMEIVTVYGTQTAVALTAVAITPTTVGN
jgi:hypothetical protein